MKYGEMTLGQIEALVNRLGGMDNVRQILSETVEMIPKKITFLVGTSKLPVNYDRLIEDSLKYGKFDEMDGDITERNFTSEELGEREVEFGLFFFNKNMLSNNSVIAKMKVEGFRPATIVELLSYGEKNPEEQRKYPIVAMGSHAEFSFHGNKPVSFESTSERYRFGELSRRGDKRIVHLTSCPLDGGWGKDQRFLAVRE